MMNFYLLDDDSNVRNILKIIIRDRGLGTVCGSSGSAAETLEDLSTSGADIVVVDLLMPEMDGITFVKNAKKQTPNLLFVMLSQVSSKDMISAAYDSGIHFYIQKPINSVEVESVLRNVSQTLSMERKIAQVQTLFTDPAAAPSPSAVTDPPAKAVTAKLKNVLQKLGIIGETGSKDILLLACYMLEHGQLMEDASLAQICGCIRENPKSVEQRVRRAAIAGMINLAHLGLEDYSNEIFLEFSNTLYNFEQVRKEMDYIRGRAEKHGNVKVRTFLNSLVLYCQD